MSSIIKPRHWNQPIGTEHMLFHVPPAPFFNEAIAALGSFDDFLQGNITASVLREQPYFDYRFFVDCPRDLEQYLHVSCVKYRGANHKEVNWDLEVYLDPVRAAKIIEHMTEDKTLSDGFALMIGTPTVRRI